MEKIRLALAIGSEIICAWTTPVYWTMWFGKQDLLEMLKEDLKELDEQWFDKIRPIVRKENYNFVQEHFIIRRQAEGQYTIEDRNQPVLTYINNQPASKIPLKLQDGDVIAIPMTRYGQDESVFLQFKIVPSPQDSQNQQFGQLLQCSQTANLFMVYWEEDPSSRKHFAVRIEKLNSTRSPTNPSGVKNLRPASETPCPYCGNKYSVYCIKCKNFICYNGIDETLSCKGCKQKYSLKEEEGHDLDVKVH